ncbi:MAG: hypothetical protein II350_07270 [Clostridia bacterium]|nr:hypothetical protein [Oscillospiraceae bacterium]MBQ1955525.1 hypothetical protein [Clostridia bacterium]
MRKPRIGLLPLYVELYDIAEPECRPTINAAHKNTSDKLKNAGLEVVDVPVCRLAREFEDAIKTFEDANCDCIVTLHLAYSPSLQSEKALAKTKLPIIILDTTPDFTYDHTTSPDLLMYNHGIHGVQDMCNLLIRNGKKFSIFAGHLEKSNVISRVFAAAKAAMIAAELRSSRVGLVGGAFEGMGDFQLPLEEFKADLGIETVLYDFEKGAKRIAEVTEEDIQKEKAEDLKNFIFDPSLSEETYRNTAPVSLALRRWVEEEKLTAFSVNFLATEGPNPGLTTMPFTECCKAMTRGTGYAGEGDVLTAALTGAVLSAYEDATFTEMFCPDWEHGTVYLSHMGEFNYLSSDKKPTMYEKPFPYTAAKNPTVAFATLKGGRALYINLAPFGNGNYTLTIAPGEMLSIEGENTQSESVNGWFKPDVSLETFLERFSAVGATHHSVLVYGDELETFAALGDILGVKTEIIR